MEKGKWTYGMKYRGFAPGAQPRRGLLEGKDCENGRFYSILTYERKLTKAEVENYELELIGEDTMGTKRYEQCKKSLATYQAKVTRIQLVLNPDTPKDQIILDYLKTHDTGKPLASQLRELVLRYIKIQEALGGIDK